MKTFVLLLSLVLGINVNAATVNRAPYVNAAVSATAGTSGAATIYTGPSGGYAIVNVGVTTNAPLDCSITVAGRNVWRNTPIAVGTVGTVASVYVGPSQALAIVNNSGTNTCTGVASGVEFKNQ